MRFAPQFCLVVALTATAINPLHAEEGDWQIEIDPATVQRTVDLAALLGSNAGLWYNPQQIERIAQSDQMTTWGPGLIRIPGGSWSDEIYWNGNGVRDGKEFDHSKFKDGFWQIDYSEYRPGFRVVNGGGLSDFHGNIDVKSAHEFVRDIGAAALVSVNAGSGTPEMAAEWARWAKQQGYAVRYWEVGNELEGQWEVGHVLPDGSEMTPEIYADRFAEIARAIKAVDPEAKVGGPSASNDRIDFGDAMLERAGELVDFVSYHTYPVGGGETNPAKIFERADSILGGMKKVRTRIREIVPDRADEIEVGITEWHVAVHEGPNTVNEISGPWSAKWIGRLIEAGVDFANIWDFLSQAHDGAHGVFGRDEALTPRGAYWALQLWGSEMGGTLLESRIAGGPGLTAFATRRENGDVALLVINESVGAPARVRLNVARRAVSGGVRSVELSTANYLWDDHRKRPVWSEPLIKDVAVPGDDGAFEVPPLSATVFHLGKAGDTTADEGTTEVSESAAPVPSFVGPDEQSEDFPFAGWVVLRDPDSGGPYLGPAQEVSITTRGPLQVEGENQRIVHRAAHRIQLTPTGAGDGQIVLTTAAGAESRHTVTLREVTLTPKVLWSFDDEAGLEGVRSSFQLSHATDNEFRKGVAEIAMVRSGEGDGNQGDRNRLIEIKPLPQFDRNRVGGVTFRMRASDDFDPAAGGAKVTAVLLSQANHWMPLGSVELSEVDAKWDQHTIRIGNPDWLPATAELYSVILLLQVADEAKGSLYVDDLGFLLRD